MLNLARHEAGFHDNSHCTKLLRSNGGPSNWARDISNKSIRSAAHLAKAKNQSYMYIIGITPTFQVFLS